MRKFQYVLKNTNSLVSTEAIRKFLNKTTNKERQ